MVIHFTRGAGQEIGTETILDSFLLSSTPLYATKTPCTRCGFQKWTEGVVSSCLDCFLFGGDLYLFEYDVSPAYFLAKACGGTCTLASSDPTEDVLHRTFFLLKNGFGSYHFFKNNCEDFAIYCKTGLLVFTNTSLGQSGQSASVISAVSAIVSSPLGFMTTSFSGLSLVSFGLYSVGRLISDIGVRCDATEVPVEKISEMSNNKD